MTAGVGRQASGFWLLASGFRIGALIGVAGVIGGEGRAAAEPSDSTLVYVGLAAAPVDYVAGVSLHEGSHALAAKLVGADVDELHLFPPGTDPHTHTFRFGWTYVHGLKTRGQQAVFFIAPKITDSLLLGGFAAIAFTHAWPSNRYAELALTVGATGLWVDFAKDVVLFSPVNDVSQFEHVTCLRDWRRVVARVIYAAADVGLALVVAQGYERTFEHTTTGATATPLVLPVLTTAF
jgi:hypothetical protein